MCEEINYEADLDGRDVRDRLDKIQAQATVRLCLAAGGCRYNFGPCG